MVQLLMNSSAALAILLVFCGVVFSANVSNPGPLVIPLWLSGQQELIETGERFTYRQHNGWSERFIDNITTPTIAIYQPKDGQARPAVIICPGGGYQNESIDKEGRWLNSVGVVGIVLKYRLPTGSLRADETPLPLRDAQRAIRLVRSRAKELKCNPDRIGIMGFSAGGHLASAAGTHFDGGQIGSKDLVEQVSSRPDFMLLVYPVISMNADFGHATTRKNLLGSVPGEDLIQFYSNELQVTPRTPPAFLVHAEDDRGVKATNSILFRDALQKAGVPVEMHIYQTGGHGFGLGVDGGEVAAWPALCVEWLKKMKFLVAP
jgi:acetyl esterase/lipase